MRWEERLHRMVDTYCRSIKNPLHIAHLEQDLLEPLAKLPEVVEKRVHQNGVSRRVIFNYLSKKQLQEVEKKCVENLILAKGVLTALEMAGRVDIELKSIMANGKSSVLGKLPSTIRYRLLHAIADDLWQNIFDAVCDDPKMRKIKNTFLKGLGLEKNNAKMR